MKPKIVTGILVSLLLVSFIVTTVNITGAFAFPTTSAKSQSAANDLLKGVDLNDVQKTADSTLTNSMNPFNLTAQQNNASLSSWGSSSNEFIIGVSESWQSYSKMEQFALSKNARIVDKVLMDNKIEAVVVNLSPSSVASFMQDVKNVGLSTYIEPRGVYQTFLTPNDPYWGQQWGPQKIQTNYAWNITTGNKTRVLVAIVDTGIDYSHPDLAVNYAPLGYDWVNNDTDPKDDNGHGTHVAGIIGAVISNGIGIAGLAQVRIMAEKGLDASGSGYYDVLARAIIHATDQNASIINMSWGGSSPSSVIEDALKYAYAHGVLLVAAAGNAASSAKLYPAAYDEVIAVTATDPNDFPAYFTSYGNWVELSAPGVDIYSTMPTYHVTLNDMGYSMNYTSLSGTSMASPHVAGVAALVWSEFPTMSRDVLRLHLRDTTDHPNGPFFDIYYGYGRINAYKALSQPLPPHDIIIASWTKPPYIEPGNTGTINVTMVNYGSNDENVTVELFINGTVEKSENITNFLSGTSSKVSLSWTPSSAGNYNVTVYVPPVAGETHTQNNIVQGFLYVGIPLRVFVLRSAGTTKTTDTWDALNNDWQRFGNRLISIDYTTLDKADISYADLNATKADVLILSCAFAWEYTDTEIEAIKQYVYEGHGFIATAGTFFYYVPNNNKFAPMFGLNESSRYTSTTTDLLNILKPSNPLFAGVPNPFVMPSVGTAVPQDGVWSSNELVGGTYVAMGYFDESAVVTYQGLVYISPWLEALPGRYNFNLQLLYNAITWSQYVKPQHQLTTTLQVPSYVISNTVVIVNATVRNNGAMNESDVDFQLSIEDQYGMLPKFIEHPPPFTLLTGDSYIISYAWNPTLVGTYNVTAYAVPVAGESDVADNKMTILAVVTQPLIHPQEGTWAQYALAEDTGTGVLMPYGEMMFNYYKYISSYQMNVTVWETIAGQGNMSGYSIVNIFNRFVERGSAFQSLWWPGMIETNIFTGKPVNILGGPVTVVGSEVLFAGSKIVDCWKLYQSSGSATFTYWYDKTTGLWIKLEETLTNTPVGLMRLVLVLDKTNMPVGFTPEHELQVALNAQTMLWSGNSSIINATVSNFGIQNETNVQLNLQINGTTVNPPGSFALAVNASKTISYAWTPPSSGMYNVTAYAPPVTGENVTSDNVATVMVRVTTLKGRVLFDQTHSNDPLSVYETWISNLRAEGFTVDTLVNRSITSSALTGYDTFVTVQAYSVYTNSELAAIQEFVANGGGLLVVGDDNPSIYTSLTSFANITWAQGGIGGYTNYINPHQVTQGVHQVYLPRPASTLIVSFTSNSSGAQVLVRDPSFNIMLAVNWYQRGRILAFADEDSLRDYIISDADNLRLATNMVAWLSEKDTAPPEIFFLLPTNGTIVGVTAVKLQWLAMDNQSGVDKYSVYRNGQFIVNTTLRSYNVSGLSAGPNSMTIVAYDKTGNHASKSVTIIVNVTLQILTPANNSYIRQVVSVNVSGSAINYTQMALFIDNRLQQSFNVSGPQTYSWNTSTEQNGIHNITLIGYDTGGNSASTSITVTVDNMPPTAIILSPENATYVHGNITMTFIVQDTTLKNKTITIGTFSYDVTGMNSMSFSTTLLTDGIYLVRLEAFDMAGNKAEMSIMISIDNTNPEAQITSPVDNAFIRRSVGIDVSYDDTNFKEAILSIDGTTKVMTTINYTPFGQTLISVQIINPVYTFDTTTATDGMHVITLKVTDYAGNSVTHEIRVYVDNTLPIGEIRSPLASTYVNGTVDISVYGYDANLVNITVRTAGGTALHVWTTSGTHVQSWNTTTVTEGLHFITLTIYDKVGNLFVHSIVVNVHNTSPTVSISLPQTGATVSGTIPINYTATDASILELFIDNSKISVTLYPIYQWDTTKVVDGNHTIRLVVTNIVGNTKEAAISVIVANAPPAYMTYLGYASTAILGLAMGMVALWAFKRKPAPTTPAA